MKKLISIAAAVGVFAIAGCGPTLPPSPRFIISLDEDVRSIEAGARVYLLMTPGGESEPFFMPPWRQIVVGCDASDEENGRWMLDGESHVFPGSLASLDGEYAIRAVIDRDPTDWKTGWAEGNNYSSKRTVVLDPLDPPVVELRIEHTIEPDAFVQTERIHELRIKSDLVSDFAGADRYLQAAVILPAGYDRGETQYPTVYILPGWGSSHTSVLRDRSQQTRYGMERFGHEKVFVFLDHNMKYGAHCFANSDVVGPWGDALVRELIPQIEKRYRVIPDGDARFLAGQSSGGWASLWLQMTYPETFGGAFAGSPDFVDFRRFGDGLDLYDESANYFRSSDGRLRPGVRDSDTGRVLFTSREEVERRDIVFGADQLTSFEAVFGPPVEDGGPRPLFDRKTGEIDGEVVEAWSRFDLARIAAERWPEIGPRLRGRIHIWVGGNDDYFLDESVRLFGRVLNDLDAGAQIKVIPGLGHDVWSDEIRSMMHAEIDRACP